MKPAPLKLHQTKQENVTEWSHMPVAATPKVMWIELTSKCPFKCVFCSRELLRGKGEHLDFGLYTQLIQSLKQPQMIRLNYSGESAHYPQLIAAIELAKSTGAEVELVSAFSSIKPKLIPQLVQSGLDRLSISLHALDETLYGEIYGHGSVAALTDRLQLLRNYQDQFKLNTPVLDFAFVAMVRNLDQVGAVVALADEFAVSQVDIHPVIRRDDIAEQFDEELDDGRLKDSFLRKLQTAVDQAQSNHPGIQVAYSTPESGHTDLDQPLSETPIYYPQALPQGAKIWGCDQDPWETIHVLANGDVVTCEVRDQVVLGNLHRENLEQIWHGANYSGFRQQYVNGLDAKCVDCVYKKAYIPAPIRSAIGPGAFHPSQLIQGWFDPEAELVWSGPEARVLITKAAESQRLQVTGLLPLALGLKRELTVSINGETMHHITHAGHDTLSLCFEIEVPNQFDQTLAIDFTVKPHFVPAKCGLSHDQRSLGVALQTLKWLD